MAGLCSWRRWPGFSESRARQRGKRCPRDGVAAAGARGDGSLGRRRDKRRPRDGVAAAGARGAATRCLAPAEPSFFSPTSLPRSSPLLLLPRWHLQDGVAAAGASSLPDGIHSLPRDAVGRSSRAGTAGVGVLHTRRGATAGRRPPLLGRANRRRCEATEATRRTAARRTTLHAQRA
ncbi:unnamed protein product [Urochloa humidicola]